MSDEYASSGFKGSVINKSADSRDQSTQVTDAATSDYPPPGDSTSSGGYGSAVNPYSAEAQRGHVADNAGLVQQSLSGANLESEIGDAKQGVDVDTRRDAREAEIRGEAQRPSYNESLEGREQAEEALEKQFQ